VSWASWEATWRIHASNRVFKSRLDHAISLVEQAEKTVGRGRLFCALSGGKDSLALLSVLHHTQAHHLLAVHVTTPLNTPGMAEAAEAAAAELGFDYECVEPDVSPCSDVWEWLAALPRDKSILERELGEKLRAKMSSGNMLVAFMYEREYQGSYSGMRADESRGRKMNRCMRGPLYRISVDHTWMALPIVDWSARDVWALITMRGLEPPPHYRMLYERFGVSPESPQSRVDCVITDEAIASRGAIAHLPTLYPELWERLAAIRPELKEMR
jgi:3'-phosphoadenosine 5'-phosphosulfate sulfotransferase (PAPS reductase)/FAD synthetase